MIFNNYEQFLNAKQRAITVFGMAGVGKTRLSALLRQNDWFHYSIDYRIGTRHMGEFIVDNFKHEAMKVPFLRDLLISDSIYISSNLTFNNLEPLSTYLGTPGNIEQGGLEFSEYQKRQEQHKIAEIASLQDIPHFIERAKQLYDCNNFIADTGGSLIEVIDVNNPNDEIIKTLCKHTALLYIKGNDDDAQKLIARYKKAPKPMYYRPQFLKEKWAEYKNIHGLKDDMQVNPKDFAIWGFEALLHDRLPRYLSLAKKYGYIVSSNDIASIRDGNDFMALMKKAILERQK